jgi:hypothetical protein
MGCQPILPGKFLATGEPPLAEFLDKIHTDSLQPPHPILHKNTPLPTALPPDLATADFVFIRRDSVAPPLTPPYSGQFKVLRRALHAFQVQIGTRSETISTHRLKPCVSLPDTAPPSHNLVRNHLNKTPGRKPRQETERKQTANSKKKNAHSQ